MNYFALDKDVTLEDLEANDELEDSMSDYSDDDEKFGVRAATGTGQRILAGDLGGGVALDLPALNVVGNTGRSANN